jgi:hypothetical protein
MAMENRQRIPFFWVTTLGRDVLEKNGNLSYADAKASNLLRRIYLDLRDSNSRLGKLTH